MNKTLKKSQRYEEDVKDLSSTELRRMRKSVEIDIEVQEEKIGEFSLELRRVREQKKDSLMRYKVLTDILSGRR